VSGNPTDAKTLAGEFERFQVVDVRYPNEWDAGHIDGAMHIPSITCSTGPGSATVPVRS